MCYDLDVKYALQVMYLDMWIPDAGTSLGGCGTVKK